MEDNGKANKDITNENKGHCGADPVIVYLQESLQDFRIKAVVELSY